MKYHISREQNFFFEKNHYIEFEGLLSTQEQSALQAICGAKDAPLYASALASKEAKKVVFLPRLARLAASLSHKRRLRYAFDQIVCAPLPEKTLEESSCIRGLAVCLYLNLESSESHALFSLTAVPQSKLPLKNGERYFVICWADAMSQYIYQPQDPHTHVFKRYGYVFGDRLKEPMHPILHNDRLSR